MTRPFQTAASILAVAAVYFCVGKFGLSLAVVHPSASAIWPPTGLALAATLLWGYRLWPGIFLGAFLVNFSTPGNPATDFGIAVGNTMEALLGAWLVNRFAHGAKAFDRARDIFGFVLLAAMVSTVVSASVGVTSVCLGREARWEQYAAIWSTWWMGDMMGDLMVSPLLLIWLRRPWPRLRPAQVQEAAGVLFAVVLVSVLIFLPRIPSGRENQLKYLCLLPLLWAAFRFRQHGASVCASVLSGIAFWGTWQGIGPFVTLDPNKSLLFLQAFGGTMTLTALVVAAVVSERQRFEQRLRVKDAVNHALAESTNLHHAWPKIARALCEAAGWDAAAVWRVDRAPNELRCVEFWHIPSLQVPEFAENTRQRAFAPGIGLPGRVWTSGQPAWIADVIQDRNFPRAPFAQTAGLRGGVCFPIKLGDEILGVLECFSRQVREPDQEFLQMLANIGSQVGQFMERVLTQEALQQHNERMSLMLGTALDAIITVDGQGSVTDWNPQAEKIFGWTKTEALGKKLTETIVPPQYHAAHERGLRHYFKTGVGPMLEKRSEITARHRDGREFPIELAITPIVLQDQVYFTAFVRDITERKQAEAELRHLAQFPEQNPSPVLRISDDGTLVYANPSGQLFLAELGCTSDGGLPDVVQAVAIEARRQACLIEREISCPDGQIIWITAVPFGDDQYVNLYGRDITERKQAEERFRLLIEAAPNALLVVDQAGKITLVNAQVEKLFGYSRDELLGQSVDFLVPERFRAAHPGHRTRFFAEPSARAMGAGRNLYGLGKDGHEIPIEIGLNPIHINKRAYVLASIIDITERQRAEQTLRDLNAELERRVARRTAELEVEVTERRQAEEVMRLALEEKKTLLEEIHHRVKNNLQIISSLLRLQGGYVEHEEDRARFEECQNRVRTMAMVHERLYRSQNLASINFGEHVRDLASMLACTYSRAAAQVQVLAEAESVPLQLETAIPAGLIVNELVSNALQHAFPAGRRGTLKVSLHSPAPGQLLLSVEDDGVGLPPGFDWDQTRSLGLRLVRDLARQIRGTLEVRQNGGTTFALCFPVVKPQYISPPPP